MVIIKGNGQKDYSCNFFSAAFTIFEKPTMSGYHRIQYTIAATIGVKNLCRKEDLKYHSWGTSIKSN